MRMKFENYSVSDLEKKLCELENSGFKEDKKLYNIKQTFIVNLV